jgi:malonate-semialdehyde dehydrogenase (acetylating)/methylmalonate-semialdehyde dehydrogenase
MPSAAHDLVPGQVLNFIDREWRASSGTEFFDVVNPATAEHLGRTPLSTAADVALAAEAAQRALPEWRRTPAAERVQYLFKLRALLEDDLESLSRLITIECG